MPDDCYCDESKALDGDLFDDALTCQRFQEQSELEKIDSEIKKQLLCRLSQQQDGVIEDAIRIWRGILVKIGCRQLSHLTLDFLTRYTCHPDKDMVSILLDVLFKYYREGDTCLPMEFLHFEMYDSASSTVVSYPWNVNAVKQLRLREMEFSGVSTKNILHFLQKNTCLTHLTLHYVVFHFPDDTYGSSCCSSVFGWLRHLTCLQSLQLCSCRHFDLSGEVNRTELTKTLLTLKSLRNLKLEGLYIGSAFVMDADFLTVVRGLDQLSLSENDLGASGAVLLKELLCSGPTALTSISLSGCSIPGEALLTHLVKNLPRKPTAMSRGSFLLKFLNLNNNHNTRHQQRELFQHLSPLVKVIFIDIHGYP